MVSLSIEPRVPFLLNINVPSLAPDQITGLEITRPGGRSYGESVREEGTGHQKRYWIARNRPVMADNGEGTDMNAAKNNRISITPLHLNLSHQEMLPRVEALLAGVPEAAGEGWVIEWLRLITTPSQMSCQSSWPQRR